MPRCSRRPAFGPAGVVLFQAQAIYLEIIMQRKAFLLAVTLLTIGYSSVGHAATYLETECYKGYWQLCAGYTDIYYCSTVSEPPCPYPPIGKF